MHLIAKAAYRALVTGASGGDYEARYEASADEVIAAGFVLGDDRDALLAEADPDRIG